MLKNMWTTEQCIKVIHNLSIRQLKKSDVWVPISGNNWRFTYCYFMQFLNSNFKEHLRWLRIYNHCTEPVQNRSKQFFSTKCFVLISLNISILFHEFNSDFEYFMHAVRVLKRSATQFKNKYAFWILHF